MHHLQAEPGPRDLHQTSLMSIAKFLARQAAKPQGIFGRLIYGRHLNRANAVVNQLVYDHLQHDENSRVLEVGFGGGDLLFRVARGLTGGRIDGVEVSTEMLANARRKSSRLGLEGTVALQLASIDALPFAEASFDCACSVHSIYFWPDINTGLGELSRVVKPGGVLVLGFSSASALKKDGLCNRGFKAYSQQQIVDVCLQTGFTAECVATTRRSRGGEIHIYRGIRQHD